MLFYLFPLEIDALDDELLPLSVPAEQAKDDVKINIIESSVFI